MRFEASSTGDQVS